MRVWMDDWGTGRWALWLALWTFGIVLLLAGGTASANAEPVLRGWGAGAIITTTVLMRGVGWKRRLGYLVVVWAVAIGITMIFDGVLAVMTANAG